MADPNVTSALNDFPKCCGDNLSLLMKTNVAVYTCHHLLCMECLKDKSLLCRLNDGGRFAFFLNDYKELKEAADILREQVRGVMDLGTSESVQQLLRTMKKFRDLIDNRLLTKPADVEINPIPQPKSLSPAEDQGEIQPVVVHPLIQPPSYQAGSLEKDPFPVVPHQEETKPVGASSPAPKKTPVLAPNRAPVPDSKKTPVPVPKEAPVTAKEKPVPETVPTKPSNGNIPSESPRREEDNKRPSGEKTGCCKGCILL